MIRNLIGHKKTATINLNKQGELGKSGADTGPDDDSQIKNKSNGVGVDVSITLGNGHPIFVANGSSVKKETLSLGEMLNHELVHGIAQMNGEAYSSNEAEVRNSYFTDEGRMIVESVPKEEAATVYQGRPISKKIAGYKYPTENILRAEQGKGARLNYWVP